MFVLFITFQCLQSKISILFEIQSEHCCGAELAFVLYSPLVFFLPLFLILVVCLSVCVRVCVWWIHVSMLLWLNRCITKTWHLHKRHTYKYVNNNIYEQCTKAKLNCDRKKGDFPSFIMPWFLYTFTHSSYSLRILCMVGPCPYCNDVLRF